MSALIVGGEEPLGAQLASRLQRLGVEVAATLPPGEAHLSHAHALTRRGVEVFFCDPLAPIALSTSLMGREEVYLCLTPRLEAGLEAGLEVGPPDQSPLNQSPLSALLESCALSTPTLPHITLLCSALALPPLSSARGENPLCFAPHFTQEVRARLMGDDPLCLTPPPSQKKTAQTWPQRLLSRLISLTLPPLDQERPSWRQARRALLEASALELCVVMYALPHHEGRLLSESGGVELLSWLKPHAAPFAPLPSLVTGLISLRAARQRRGASEIKGVWGLGSDNLRLNTLEDVLGLELTPAQRRAVKEGGEDSWPLSSRRAERAFTYPQEREAPTNKPAS